MAGCKRRWAHAADRCHVEAQHATAAVKASTPRTGTKWDAQPSDTSSRGTLILELISDGAMLLVGGEGLAMKCPEAHRYSRVRSHFD